VRIESNTSQDLIKRHLKEEYSLGCQFTQLNRSLKKDLPSIELNEDVLIGELINFFNRLGFRSKIFNSDGISIPAELSLKEAKNFNNDRSEDFDFQQLMSSLTSISKSTDYGDIEWIKRLFIRALKKTNKPSEIQLVSDLLAKIHSENDKFLDSDHVEVLRYFPVDS